MRYAPLSRTVEVRDITGELQTRAGGAMSTHGGVSSHDAARSVWALHRGHSHGGRSKVPGSRSSTVGSYVTGFEPAVRSPSAVT